MCDCVIVHLFMCSLILLISVEVSELKYPGLAKRHTLVRPVVLHGRTKRELSTTRHESGTHHHEVLVTIEVEGEEYILNLTLNHDLLPEGHTISYQEGGRTVVHRPKKEEIELCQYLGHIRGKPSSWVRLSTCHGLRGTINDGTKIRFIEPANGSDIQSLHYIYEASEVERNSTCGYDGQRPATARDLMETLGNYTRVRRHTQYNTNSVKGGPVNSNSKSRYVELVLVADYAQYLGAGRDVRVLHHQLQEMTNLLNAMYVPLNIFIALTGVEIWTEGDMITLHPNSTKTLDNFLEYRHQLFKSIGPHDNAQLVSPTNFDGGVIGKGYLSSMCTDKSGAIIHHEATNKLSAITSTAQTMAHEIGHNFGMLHDARDCECREENCIMGAKQSNPLPKYWSKCSLKYLVEGFTQGLDYCLWNQPTSLLGPSCGNGFLEPGEECDCGTTLEDLGSTSSCRACCTDTCKLRSHAKCATGACCDLQTCQLKSASTMCRSAERECDLPEYCTGKSEFCPHDVFKMDTTPCSDKAYCVQGWCRSHDYQCRLLWGSTGKNSQRECYDKNLIRDDQLYNCGYDLNGMAQECAQKDVQCGRLHCNHLNNRLEFGDFARVTKDGFAFAYGKLHSCRTARIKFPEAVDPGLVPDGASCGDGQMCLKQQCLPVNEVRRQMIPQPSEGCLANCSEHGVCNSKSNCHCDDGFAPPFCDVPGDGGSVDSGPASDPTVQNIFKLIMYIIFLGIVPLIVLILLVTWLIKRKMIFSCRENNKIHQKPITFKVKEAFSIFSYKQNSPKNKKITIEDIKIINDNKVEIVTTVKANTVKANHIHTYVLNGHNSRVPINKGTENCTKLKDTVEHLTKPIHKALDGRANVEIVEVGLKSKRLPTPIHKIETPRTVITNDTNSLKLVLQNKTRIVTDMKDDKKTEDVIKSKPTTYNANIRTDGPTKELQLNRNSPVISKAKLKPVRNSPVQKKIGMKKNTNPQSQTGIDVKTMKNYYEQLQ